ncbi:MAG: SCP2 sterol-binding domain-containing protein [Ardenticatenales bacterium]|nr:SCP2 sterol-binding domain-containing protein [Ardenticatenales bacterium]
MPTIKQLFEWMPQYANEAAIQGVTKTIQFNVTGDDEGQYYIQVADGKVDTGEGAIENPDATITTPADVWLQITSGQLNGAVAYMTGKFKATGDLTVLMAMQNWFNMPGG